MKLNLPTLLTLTAVLFAALAVDASAQGIKIAVVDMQDALNRYYKTDVEVGKINAMADEKRKNIDERQAAYQQMTDKAMELDKTARDTLLSEDKRKAALQELQALIQERDAKAKEIQDAQRKASSEVMQARQEMEATLVGEIKDAVNAIVEAEGHDLVFDKSFLPKANKAILYTSENVVDLTEGVVSALNAGAPSN
jgi:Skp family chaperone for outer membrane proteins